MVEFSGAKLSNGPLREEILAEQHRYLALLLRFLRCSSKQRRENKRHNQGEQVARYNTAELGSERRLHQTVKATPRGDSNVVTRHLGQPAAKLSDLLIMHRLLTILVVFKHAHPLYPGSRLHEALEEFQIQGWKNLTSGKKRCQGRMPLS
jgi:hypothetical protein